MRIETPHRELRSIRASRVVGRAAGAAARRADAAVGGRRRARRRDRLARRRFAGARRSFRAGSCRCSTPATDLCARELSAAPPDLEAARDLTPRIKADFVYDPKATEVSTPPIEAFESAARRLPGFRPCHDRRPARPRPAGALCQRLYPHHSAAGQAAPAGADATHAWVALWCGPGFGWIGLDPTNAHRRRRRSHRRRARARLCRRRRRSTASSCRRAARARSRGRRRFPFRRRGRS